MKFTQDWFSHNIQNFQHIHNELKTINRVLEIGCFEGRATCWMLQNMIADDGVCHVIDTFEGSAEHSGLKLDSLRDAFMSNINEAKKDTQTVSVFEGTSYDGIAELIQNGGGHPGKFDLIYVDGSHAAPDVLTDACMAFNLLRPGGIMLFDDYMWMGMGGILNQPKIAIDAFTTMFSDKCVVRMVGYQLAIQKNT